MSMTLAEAIRIANSRANEHAPVTFELAATLLREEGRRARKPVRPLISSLAQLAILKAELGRIKSSFDAGDNGNAHARIEAARMVHMDEEGLVWWGK